MGVHKTVNGAYRYSLMPTYYVKGCSPLALPLGELSPQVTERVLQPFSNDNINLCTHITEIPVYIPVGESQNLQPKRHQELRTFSIISKPLRFVMLRAIQFNDQSGRSAIKVHLVWSLVTLSVLAALGHLSQGERQGMLARYTERCIEVRFYQFGFPVHPAYACGASAVLSTAAAVFFFFPRFSVEISPAFASASFVSTGPVSS